MTLVSIGDHVFMRKHLPDLGHKVEDIQVYTWRVTDWPRLKKRVRSPEFACGGDKWNILLYPFGNHPEKPAISTSVYLEGKPKHPLEEWHPCVQFAISISNPKDPTGVYYLCQAHHRFVPEDPDWGFTRYAKMEDLVCVREGSTRPIIENDSADITVYMRVLKDPTGVLWHSFINYDSKKHTGYVGVKNQGTTDVLSVCLQIFFCFTALRKVVYETPCGDDTATPSVTSALQTVLHDMQTSSSAVSSTKLTKAFGWKRLDCFMRHHLTDIRDMLQDRVGKQAAGTLAAGALDSLLVGKRKVDVEALNIDFETSHVEEYKDILVEVKGVRDLHGSLHDYISTTILDMGLKYDTKTHGFQAARKRITFMSFPPILHIRLNRLNFDFQQDAMVKYTGRHEYPSEIDFAAFLDSSADKTQSWEYKLHGVIMHAGDLKEGHYFCFIKPGRASRWLKFDDQLVTPASHSQVFEESYGIGGGWQTRATCAYVLVYVRETMIDEVFRPVTELDIPPQLKVRFEQERSVELKRKHKLLQISQEITVKVVDDESFRKYQGFDMATFSSSQIVSFRVPKTRSFRKFKSTVAQHFNYDEAQFRLWVQVRRANQTVRPDTPIFDHDPSLTIDVVRTRMAQGMSELLLYLDVIKVTEQPLVDVPAPTVMILLKHFDASQQSLLGLGRRHVRTDDKPIDLQNDLILEMKLPESSRLKFYEEIKPGMTESMKRHHTYAQSEIQNGDIVCFQVALSEPEKNRLENNGLSSSPTQFYSQLWRSSSAVPQTAASLVNMNLQSY